MILRDYAPHALAIALLCFAIGPAAHASSTTNSGTFSADNSVYTYNFTTSGTETFTFETTSYASGGFVPVLTLFSSTGPVVGFDGADGTCSGSEMPSSSTGICDDAYLQQTLAAGSYALDLTEFPNVAIGNLSDGFLFGSDPTATGDVCGVSGGMFLESDLATCVQRTDAYSLTITSAAATPEPSSIFFGLPVAALLLVVSRRHLA